MKCLNCNVIDIDNNNKMSPHFYYEHGESYESFTFEESESSTLNEFVEKFKNGNLDRSSLSFNNIKILELNDEYAFTFGENAGKNYYYFAKKIVLQNFNFCKTILFHFSNYI